MVQRHVYIRTIGRFTFLLDIIANHMLSGLSTLITWLHGAHHVASNVSALVISTMQRFPRAAKELEFAGIAAMRVEPVSRVAALKR